MTTVELPAGFDETNIKRLSERRFYAQQALMRFHPQTTSAHDALGNMYEGGVLTRSWVRLEDSV